MTSRWYVAATHPAREVVALENLMAQHFEAFLPLVDRKLIRRNKPKLVREALYRSYVFIRFDPDEDPWMKINGTRGVRKLVCYASERPRPLQLGVVEALIKQSRAGGFEEIAGKTKLVFQTGSILEITIGPMEGQVVTCLAEEDQHVRALLSCFGRDTVVNIPLAHLRAA